MATKFKKIGPKATQDHDKWTLESWEIQFLQKMFLQDFPCQTLGFSTPDTQIQTQKSSEKGSLEIYEQLGLFVQMYPTTFLNGSPKSARNQ